MARNGRMRMDGETIKKIMNLHKKGMSTREIMDYVDMSESSVNSYTKIIDAAFGNGKFCLNPKAYNKSAVTDFCRIVGVAVPMNTHYEMQPEQIQFTEPEKPLIIDTPDERLICDARKALVNSVRHIYTELYAVAKSLELILKTNEEGNTNE